MRKVAAEKAQAAARESQVRGAAVAPQPMEWDSPLIQIVIAIVAHLFTFGLIWLAYQSTGNLNDAGYIGSIPGWLMLLLGGIICALGAMQKQAPRAEARALAPRMLSRGKMLCACGFMMAALASMIANLGGPPKKKNVAQAPTKPTATLDAGAAPLEIQSAESIERILRDPSRYDGVHPWSRELCDAFSAEAKRRSLDRRSKPLAQTHSGVKLQVTGAIVDFSFRIKNRKKRWHVFVLPSWAGQHLTGDAGTGVECEVIESKRLRDVIRPGGQVTLQGEVAAFTDQQLQSDELKIRAGGIRLEDCQLVEAK
jgi:hypothetical protein